MGTPFVSERAVVTGAYVTLREEVWVRLTQVRGLLIGQSVQPSWAFAKRHCVVPDGRVALSCGIPSQA
jgi:hypothetical protein